MFQCRFTDGSGCNTVVWDVADGEVVRVWGQGVYGNSALSAQVCCEPKTALKINFID